MDKVKSKIETLLKELNIGINEKEERRKKFCEELYRRIEELKKLQELPAPFTNELGRLRVGTR